MRTARLKTENIPSIYPRRSEVLVSFKRLVFALGFPICLSYLTCGAETRMGGSGNGQAMEQARSTMVRTQIADRGVTDKAVLDAMARVPRHEFVPHDIQAQAYADSPLPIGHGQTISQPYIVAYMSEKLEVKKGMKVLEVGTGSAYQTVILAELGAQVYTIEIVPELCHRARQTLTRLGYTGVQTRCGNGYLGWPEEAPFDRVLLTAAPEKLPQALLKQLGDGGILVAPVGVGVQQLLKVTRRGDSFAETNLLPVRFVPMVDSPRE